MEMNEPEYTPPSPELQAENVKMVAALAQSSIIGLRSIMPLASVRAICEQAMQASGEAFRADEDAHYNTAVAVTTGDWYERMTTDEEAMRELMRGFTLDIATTGFMHEERDELLEDDD